MNEISEQILSAIDVVYNERISQLAFDKTIQAKIFRIVNLDTGEYKVRYNGNIFSAFCDDPEQQYEVDEDVYVSVPEGNFSNRKLIISTVSAKSLAYSQLTQLQNTIVSASPSITEFYQGIHEEPYQVVAGAAVGSAEGTDIIYQGDEEYSPDNFHALFQQYARNYNLLRISCSFLTQFHCTHSEGNYGIELEFYTTSGEPAAYRLDITQFNGDPYSFTTYAPQYAIMNLPKDYIIGLKSIKLFQEGFIPDRFIENGKPTDNQNLTVPNIFAKDLMIDFVEKQDWSSNSYYLSISTPQGTAFSSTVSNLDLVGRLLYQGRDVMDAEKCECRWYERDLSVMIGMTAYDKLAGFGWQRLEEASNVLSRSVSDVNCRQQYKLIVIYNKQTTTTAEVEIFNQRSAYDLALAQTTELENTYLSITDENLFGNWYMSFPDGSYSQVPGGEHVNRVNISPYLSYSSVTFYCAIETADRDYLGTLDYVISNTVTEGDVSLTYSGEDIFRYDANGDIDIDYAELDKTLQIAVSWRDGSVTSYTLDWLFRNGDNTEVEVPKNRETALNPENSMLQDIWVDNQLVLHYNISKKYRVNYNNNMLLVRVKTIFGDTYFFEKEILFLKDGDQGTNGTTYVASIRPCTEEGVKLSGLNPLIYNEDRWQNTLNLRCFVYKDGELINNDTNSYSIQYRWDSRNITIVGNKEDRERQQIVIQGEDSGLETGEFYVKVQVTIADIAHGSRLVDIYASLPIDVAVGGSIDVN